MIPELSPSDVKSRQREFKLIDVRRPDEWSGELGHIEGALFATLETDLDAYLNSLSKDDSYVFICRSGGRSGRATELAQAKGFKKVYNMTGGMLAWNAHGFEVKR
jgi:hydroxyacylglutathione hydrolase